MIFTEGKKYKIKTKKGIVEKWLSFIDKNNKYLYFVGDYESINMSNLGGMFGTRGTMHKVSNVISEC